MIASPAESPTRYAVIGGVTRAVEFDGYRYDWATGEPVASTWRLTDEPPTWPLGAHAFLFPRGERVELTAAALLPLVVAINLPVGQA
jgi:hypothetical protein